MTRAWLGDVFLLLAVALLTSSQVLQKVGAARRLAGKRDPKALAAAFLSPELMAAGLAIVAGTALWLLVLYRMDVSRAFPFLSLGSVLVVAASRVFLKEHVPMHRWAGVVLIASGIAFVGTT